MTSPRTARRLSRILSMLPWVIANPGATVAEVCERFGYTKAQLVGDLDLVFVCGLPGYGPGDLMVAYIDDDEVIVEMADYFSTPVRLTPPEGLGLLAAGMALVSSGQAPPALERGVDKLAAVILPDATDAMTVDLTEPEFVGELRGAAHESLVSTITYTGLASGETTQRVIEPWAVSSTLGNWYVSGYCRLAEDERVFRIDRIRMLDVSEETFEPPAERPDPMIAYTPGPDDVTAVIRLESQARWVTDYYPVDLLAETDDGGVTVRFAASDPTVAARLLLRLGEAAALLEGDEVAETLADLRRRIAVRYAPD